MKKIVIVLTVVLILTTLIFLITANSKQYDFSVQLSQGKVYNLQVVNCTKMNTSIFKVLQTFRHDFSFEVIEVVDTTYGILVRQNNVDWEATADILGMEETVPEKLTDAFKELLQDTTFKIYVTNQGEVVSLDGIDQLRADLVQKFSQRDTSDPNTQIMSEIIMSLVSEEYLKGIFTGLFQYIPDEPVKIGDGWIRKSPNIQAVPIEAKTVYSLKEVTQEEMIIEANLDVNVSDLIRQRDGEDEDINIDDLVWQGDDEDVDIDIDDLVWQRDGEDVDFDVDDLVWQGDDEDEDIDVDDLVWQGDGEGVEDAGDRYELIWQEDDEDKQLVCKIRGHIVVERSSGLVKTMDLNYILWNDKPGQGTSDDPHLEYSILFTVSSN